MHAGLRVGEPNRCSVRKRSEVRVGQCPERLQASLLLDHLSGHVPGAEGRVLVECTVFDVLHAVLSQARRRHRMQCRRQLPVEPSNQQVRLELPEQPKPSALPCSDWLLVEPCCSGLQSFLQPFVEQRPVRDRQHVPVEREPVHAQVRSPLQCPRCLQC